MRTSAALLASLPPFGRVVPRLVLFRPQWPPGCPPHRASGARALRRKYRGSRWPSHRGALEQSKHSAAIRSSFHPGETPSSFSLDRDEPRHIPIDRTFLSAEGTAQRRPPRSSPRCNSVWHSSIVVRFLLHAI